MGLAMQRIGAPVNPAYLGLLASVVVGGALAGVIGYFLFSAGVRGAYFVIVTLALSIIVEQIAVSQSQITGGWNGMFIDRMSLTFGPLGEVSLFDDAAIYYFVLLVVASTFGLVKGLSRAPFGKLLVGIRENEDRLIALGVRTPLYKTGAFALSGAIACLAGALYGTHANFVAPSLAGVLFSTEVVVWVAIGGRNSLLGALLGGILVASLSNYLSAIVPRYWQLALGILFVLVIVYLRGGIAGALSGLFANRRRS
jgi:urea ABC transporter permease protein UrtC